jgi:ABC transport system ATP-binding/permease protein
LAEPFKLIIEDDEGRRSVVPVELGDVSIGRLEGNTIRLNERNVSRHHARITKDNGQILVEDLDSYNGLYINGTRVAGRQELHEGDLLRIGDFHLELRGEGMQRRSEETTQRTLMPDLESTQPEIRVPGKPAAGVPSAPDQPEQRAEPTAIIRLDHVADVEEARGKAPGAISGEKSKLLCVSTNFAGQEFEITKTEVVIGRTEDNDIQIDHRSVSRHHAKIVTAGKSYKIVDMKSANGTLVNNEQYAQLALKAGDLIELGHVKFRFVPPGERYSLTAEEQANVKSAQSGGSGNVSLPAGANLGTHDVQVTRVNDFASMLKQNPLGAAAAGAVVMGVLVLIVWLIASGGDDAPVEQAANVLPQPAVTGTDPGDGAPDKLMAKAKEYMGERQWVKAIRRLDLVLEKEPGREDALGLREQADAELKAQGFFDSASKSIREQAWGDAWNHLGSIPPKSVYVAEAGPLREQVKGELVAERVKGAREAIDAGDPDGANELIAEIETLDAGAGELAELKRGAANIKKGAGSKSSPGHGKTKVASTTTPPPVTTPPKPPKEEAPPPPPPKGATGDPAQLYKDGVAALQANDVNKAIDVLSKCVQVDRTASKCYRAMGIAYARSGNGPKAARYYKLYLKYDPNAPDKAQVEQLLKAYEGK